MPYFGLLRSRGKVKVELTPCPTPFVLETARLLLRRWQPRDLAPFAALNADPRAMEFFPSIYTRAQSLEIMNSLDAKIEENGFGYWAAELKDNHEFVGLIGLAIPGPEIPCSPCVEIGWRLAHAAWGKGIAQEGARASLHFGFGKLGLKEIVSFTAAGNHRSRRVMEAIGMSRDERGDFDHPKIAVGHVLRRHVLYRIRNPDSSGLGG